MDLIGTGVGSTFSALLVLHGQFLLRYLCIVFVSHAKLLFFWTLHSFQSRCVCLKTGEPPRKGWLPVAFPLTPFSAWTRQCFRVLSRGDSGADRHGHHVWEHGCQKAGRAGGREFRGRRVPGIARGMWTPNGWPRLAMCQPAKKP